MSLTKVSYSMIQGAPINVFDYMTAVQIADVQAGTLTQDVTTALQNAIAAGSSIYCPTGQYLISGQLNVYAKTLFGDGWANTVFVSNMSSGAYAAITIGKLGWTSGSDTTSGGMLRDFAVQCKSGSTQVIGVMVTGAHNPTLFNIRTYETQIGFYVENTSEMLMMQCGDFVSSWSFVFDNRNTRTSSQRPGGYTGSGNDVSSCTLNMLTSSFSQQNGILLMNCGTMNFTGLTMTAFADNPSTDPTVMPYGFPVSLYGINFYGSPLGNEVRNSNVTGAVFEADEGEGNARICINIYSPTAHTAPIDNITFDSCAIQTYSNYVQNNDCTCFIQTNGYLYNITISVNNCGYIYYEGSTNTYFTGKLFNMVGQANIICHNVYPPVAFSNSTLSQGFDYRSLNFVPVYEMPISSLTPGAGNIPSGWTGTGAYSTKLVATAHGDSTPPSLNFVGGSGAAGMNNVISFTPYMFDPMSIVVILIYSGNDLTWDWNVNSQTDTQLSTISDINTARYGNCLYGNVPNSNSQKIRVLSFPAFSAVTAFQTLGISLSINSSDNTFSSNLYYCAIGYIPRFSTNNAYS